jgi:anti-sigma factor RsiW
MSQNREAAGFQPQQSVTCRELVELVTDYFEAALSPDDEGRFEAHLAGCAACRNHVEQMRQTIQVIGMLSEEMIPAQVQSELLEIFWDWKQQRM